MDTNTARFNMIEQQIRPWGVFDPVTLSTLAEVPREVFVPEKYSDLAFADYEIPIGNNQFMMNPKIEGHLLQALELKASDKALEIGTGSGFITACLAHTVSNVESIDLYDDFIEEASSKLSFFGLNNIRLKKFDVTQSVTEGPAISDVDNNYDVIALTASLPEYVHDFELMLNIGGRMFVIVGDGPLMVAMKVKRVDDDVFKRTNLFETSLPPLVNFKRNIEFSL
ncbi:MAG: protein-L-isoaspartate O-methyltransferase [Pseudomonadota bacterium]